MLHYFQQTDIVMDSEMIWDILKFLSCKWLYLTAFEPGKASFCDFPDRTGVHIQCRAICGLPAVCSAGLQGHCVTLQFGLGYHNSHRYLTHWTLYLTQRLYLTK